MVFLCLEIFFYIIQIWMPKQNIFLHSYNT